VITIKPVSSYNSDLQPMWWAVYGRPTKPDDSLLYHMNSLWQTHLTRWFTSLLH